MRIVGVNEGIENKPQVLRTPPINDAIEIKRMYGNVILSKLTVSANLSGSFVKPGAVIQITTAAQAIPIIRSRFVSVPVK